MTSQYPLILSLQLFMIFLDLVFNAVCTIISNNNTTLLMVYMLQDTLIVIAIIVLAITFSSTFVFQAGLISILLRPLFLGQDMYRKRKYDRKLVKTGERTRKTQVDCSELSRNTIFSQFQSILKFSSSIVYSVLYLLVSVFYHYLTLNRHWGGEKSEIWPPLIYGLYVIHRLLAILYYTSYKRAALLLSDPKYHGISEWLKMKIREVGR